MTQKLTPLILIAWLILLPISQSTAAPSNPIKEAQQAEKIKAGIAKAGIAKKSASNSKTTASAMI